jgi:HEAT repeat protein
MNRLLSRLAVCLAALALGVILTSGAAAQIARKPLQILWQPIQKWPLPQTEAQASPAAAVREESSVADGEQTLRDAGIVADGPGLVAFFQARSLPEVEQARLEQLVEQLGESSSKEYDRARAEIVGLGPLALQRLRRTANDLDHPKAAERATRCLPWLEGPASRRLLIAAAHHVERLKPEGAAGALLAYVGFADDPDVRTAVNAALEAVAAPADRPDPALLRGLSDPLAARRAAAGAALCRAAPARAAVEVRKLLKDPAPAVRLGAARALAEANDADAFPVLIDLLADLPAEERKPIEEMLTRLAGEWAPVTHLVSEDRIARRVHRDAWAAWWKNTDGEALLAVVDEHILTSEKREKIQSFIGKLGDEDFSSREAAGRSLFEMGRIVVPQLRKAAKDRDVEVARRAQQLIARIEKSPSHSMPAAALRLLAVRKPEGAAAALLGYLPFAEEEQLSEDVGKALTALAERGGKPDEALVRALSDEQATVRAAAAEALAQGAGKRGREAVQKLLQDKDPAVRLRVALVLVRAGERERVPVLIDLLAELPEELVGQAEDALHQLAGESAPEAALGSTKEEKKKCRQAWLAWWKANSRRVDVAHLNSRPWYGYTLLCDINNGRVYEIDRAGKERWSINGLQFPIDAVVVGRNRVLIAEYHGQKVTERDFEGKIIWSKEGLQNNPVSIQRLANGNTFIGTHNQILEVDRTGKEVYSINNVPGGFSSAYRMRSGKIVALTQFGQCVLMDTAGKQLKSFAMQRRRGGISGFDVLPNGHIVVADQNFQKVLEYDGDGKKIAEVDAPFANGVTALPNGHYLVSSNQQRAFEVDRTGKVVWEHKANGNIFRARRR